MKVHEIMTAHARCVAPENTLVEAAGLMRELDVGALPVCEDDRLAGMVTDRDLALRAVADGRDPTTTVVRDVMTPGVVYVFADQDVEEVTRVMDQRQIRRVPVLNREKRLVGIVSLGDIAISSNPAFSGMALREVSEPTNPTARQRRLTQQSEPMVQAESREATAATNADSTGETRRRSSQRRTTAKSKTRRTTGAKRRQSGTGRRSAGKASPGRSRSKRSAARAAR
jgi:CBS domain-containing protein